MENPVVSIIIPVYNAEHTLSRCLESILVQTYDNIEVILVDDGSKDGSLALCKSYAERDGRVKVVHTANQGSGPARNTGVQNASGTWAYFPDSDDYLVPDAIERMVHHVDASGCDLLVFGFDTYDKNGELVRRKVCPDTIISGDDVRVNYEHHCMMNDALCIQGAPWNKFFKMSVIKEFGVEYPPLRRHQDECFICRYVNHAQSVCFSSDILYYYYANDPVDVRRKYPIDYIDCVKGMYKIKAENFLSWNPDNAAVKAVLSDEFVCNMIWSFELSFNPKFAFSHKQRINWMRKQLSDIDLSAIDRTLVRKRIYQGPVFFFIRFCLPVAYLMIGLKYKLTN